MDYEVEKWQDVTKGFEKEPEGGVRCSKCFALRLEKTAQYAADNNFEIYSTSLTSGRNKKADVIFPLGEFFGNKYGIEFLAEDWKKGGRQERGRKMVEEKGIYRQNYCGCVHSLKSKI